MQVLWEHPLGLFLCLIVHVPILQPRAYALKQTLGHSILRLCSCKSNFHASQRSSDSGTWHLAFTKYRCLMIAEMGETPSYSYTAFRRSVDSVVHCMCNAIIIIIIII